MDNPPAMPERLERQIRFLVEIDRLKAIQRRSLLIDGRRRENSAEHSWHIAVMALVLAEYAEAPVDLCRVLKMLLVHDIVEIDAGDTYAYDPGGKVDQAAREAAAAERIFGLLPADQAAELRALWQEFDAGETAEAKFAHAVDRLMPLLHNFHTEGESWQAHGVDQGQVQQRVSAIAAGSQRLWEYADGLVRRAVEAGYLQAAPGDLDQPHP